MAEFLPGVLAVILEQADVFDARIALEIEDALGGQPQEMSDLIVAGVPQMPVVTRIFDQNFMRADRVHAVIDPVAAAARFTLDMVKRTGMHDGTRRPRNAGRIGRFREITCKGAAEASQKGQTDSERGPRLDHRR